MIVSSAAARVAVVVTVTVAMLAMWQSARGGEQPAGMGSGASAFPNGIVVVGDSITARYNDEPGDDEQGWWSIVGRHFASRVTTYAQPGSGYLRPGNHCTGTRFIDRPEAFKETSPSLFIIEGGRNDWASCREGQYVPSTDHELATAVDHYFDVITAELPGSTRIVVLSPPWGPMDQWQRRRVTSIVHAAAQRHDLEYVNTAGTLADPGRVVDGVHPNRAGNESLAARVISALG